MTNEERRRREAYLARRRKRKRKRTIQIIRRVACSVGMVVCIGLAVTYVAKGKENKGGEGESLAVNGTAQVAEDFRQKVILETPDYTVDLLTPNEYSRPQTATEKITGIVIHYTANPGTTAQQNRSYFENLKDSGETKASSHFVVGMEGEIVQCIPSSEIAYASNERNTDTISIECCHPGKDGKFTEETYDTLVELTAWLCGKFNVPVENVIRHYDVSGKKCPLYYVEHEGEWKEFKEDVQKYLDTYGVESEEDLS